MIENLTSYKFNFLVKRGNDAILKALKIAKKLGYSDVFMADQGGWFTYPQYAKKLKLNVNFIESNLSLVNPDSLKNIKNSIVILNSSPGYFCYQPMKDIEKICSLNGNLLIEDISGIIGEKCHGDIIVSSLGLGKPLNYGTLGLIGFNDEKYNVLEFTTPQYDEELLTKRINGLGKRTKYLKKKAQEVKLDLKKYDIIHSDHEAINVIIKHRSETEKKSLIEYCNQKGYEYKECPRSNKVNIEAISIEIKLLPKNF